MLFQRIHPLNPHRRTPLLLFRATLVNVKLKWVKDHSLDSVVSRQKHLPSVVHLISSTSTQTICTHNLIHPRLRDPTSFLRRFPALFTQLSPSLFALTPAAQLLRHQQTLTPTLIESDLIRRLRKLLMLTSTQGLPLHTLDLLRFDLGLEHDYNKTLIPRYPQFFILSRPNGDERTWLRLASWDPTLAVSALEMQNGGKGRCLAFPLSFTRGFGLKRKCWQWLREWQTLPYTSPYVGAQRLDPRTDVAEKRMVGVFHELLHLMVGKMTERRNVSNMRGVLGLPQKFTKVFERHPGIFYLSQKLGTQTVVLREAYGACGELIEKKHPLVEIRERYLELMRVRRKDMQQDEDDNIDGCLEGEKQII